MTLSHKRMKDIENIRDADIDYSDIPATDAAFWANAEMVEPDKTQQISLRIKQSVLDYFKADGKKGYQSRINAVLETYVRAQQHNSHTPDNTADKDR